MNNDQFLSLVRSLLKIGGAALTAHGLTQAANLMNSEDLIGVVMTVAGLVWSHFNHASTTTPPPSTPKAIVLIVLLLPALVFPLGGCSSPAQTTAYNTIGSVEATAQSAYDSYCIYAVTTGATNNLPAASRAFNNVQLSLAVAAATAQNGTNALAPAAAQGELAAFTNLLANFKSH